MNKTSLLEKANAISKGNMLETLGIVFTAIDEKSIEATMPVIPKVHQPFGLLHGGATAALAESIGSSGSAMLLGDEADVVGIEISASHLKSVRSGLVTGRGELLHKGRKIHVWDIKVTDETGRLISACRMTNMILPRS
ncbi:MAG: hotdog fold thioesterase [Flavobacteriales bacterium]|nr:hotdog fold thioesterase [Flavobacteriales bacterium]